MTVNAQLRRSVGFAELTHSDPEREENYSDQQGFYLNYRSLLISGDKRVIALLDKDGFWRSELTGEVYSEISFSD